MYSIDLNCERAIIIKISNFTIAKNLRWLTSKNLIKYTEKYYWNTIYKTVRFILIFIQFIAVKILQLDNL